jgi:hypothetical protein
MQLAILPLALALSLGSPAETPLTIEAARIVFLDLEDRIEASGNVQVAYGTDRVRADRIVADLVRREVLAEGEVTLARGEEEVRSARVLYNWETRVGRAEGASTLHRGVIVTAGELTSTPARTDALRSRFTTCDRPRPHYFLAARRIVLYPNDRVVFYDASVYLLGSRIFYVPRYSKSLRQDEDRGIGLPTVTLNSRDTIMLRREATLLEDERRVLDLDAGLSLRRGFVGGLTAIRRGTPGWIASAGIRQEAPNQRARFLEVDRLPEVGLLVSSRGDQRRPPRVPASTQQIRIARETEEPRWFWTAESTVGYFKQRAGRARHEDGELDRDGGRFDARVMLSRRQARIGPVSLGSLRLLARTSLYTNGERFTLVGLGIGNSWRLKRNLRVSLHRFLQATDGSTPFRFDAPDLLREWRPATVLSLGQTELSWLGRYDSERGEFFDQEVAVARVFHCLRPRISYRTRRAQFGFDLQVVGIQYVRPAEPDAEKP